MNIEMIINPKTGAVSGIHKCEAYLTELIGKLNKVTITPINAFKRPNFLMRMFYLFSSLVLPGLESKRTKNEVLFLLDQQLALLLNFIPIRKKVAVIIYDVFPTMKYYSKYYSLIDRLRYNLMIKALKRADAIITMTEMVKKELVEKLGFDGQKIYPVYLGIDHCIYRPIKETSELRKKLVISEKDKILLYVGSEEPRKNLDGLIMAFNELKKKFPDCKLIKIGRSDWPGAREKLLNLISELGLKDDVIIKENIPEEEMPLYYSLADLFVSIPIFEGGWANPVAEAMACGCAVMASKPAIEELVGGYGVLVDPEDCKEVANNIYYILSDKDKLASLKEKSLFRAKMFSWEKTAKEMIDVVKNMD